MVIMMGIMRRFVISRIDIGLDLKVGSNVLSEVSEMDTFVFCIVATEPNSSHFHSPGTALLLATNQVSEFSPTGTAYTIH
jgi:hypothetical protein